MCAIGARSIPSGLLSSRGSSPLPTQKCPCSSYSLFSPPTPPPTNSSGAGGHCCCPGRACMATGDCTSGPVALAGCDGRGNDITECVPRPKHFHLDLAASTGRSWQIGLGCRHSTDYTSLLTEWRPECLSQSCNFHDSGKNAILCMRMHVCQILPPFPQGCANFCLSNLLTHHSSLVHTLALFSSFCNPESRGGPSRREAGG